MRKQQIETPPTKSPPRSAPSRTRSTPPLPKSPSCRRGWSGCRAPSPASAWPPGMAPSSNWRPGTAGPGRGARRNGQLPCRAGRGQGVVPACARFPSARARMPAAGSAGRPAGRGLKVDWPDRASRSPAAPSCSAPPLFHHPAFAVVPTPSSAGVRRAARRHDLHCGVARQRACRHVTVKRTLFARRGRRAAGRCWHPRRLHLSRCAPIASGRCGSPACS